MQAFTPKQRLLAAARKQRTDRPPCICPGGMMNMIFQEIMVKSDCRWPEAHLDPEQMAGLALALNEAGGFENYGVPFCMTVEAEAMGARVNLGNQLCEPHVVDYLLQTSAQVDILQPLDIYTGRTKVVIDAIRILKAQNTEVPIVGNLTGPVSTAGTLVDIAVLLKEFRKRPAEAEKLMAFIADQLITFGKAQIAAGADAICISEPSGTGEILGPQRFVEYSLCYLNRILDALEAPVKIVHICGSLQSVYKIIPELHCDVFSFDAVVPIEEIKIYIPEKAVMGNLNTHALASMSAEKVASLTRLCLAKGVDIAAPACGLSTTTPLRNVQSMVQAAKEK